MQKNNREVLCAQHLRFASVAQLSRLFHVHRTTVNRWERVGAQLALSEIESLASRGLPVEVLMEGMRLRSEDRQLIETRRQELDDFLDRG